MKHIFTGLFFLLTSVAALTGCNNSSTIVKSSDSTAAFDVNKMRPIIEAKDSEWSKAVVNSDSAAMVNHYTKDGKIFPPNSDAVVGREAIAGMVSAVMKYGIKEYKDEITSLYGNEDYIIEEGIYTMGDGKGHVIDKGKYIAIWKKEDGDWKIYSNMYNTSLPTIPAQK
jgi:uncharacterized protein (TIGR02246 family)